MSDPLWYYRNRKENMTGESALNWMHWVRDWKVNVLDSLPFPGSVGAPPAPGKRRHSWAMCSGWYTCLACGIVWAGGQFRLADGFTWVKKRPECSERKKEG